MIAPNAKTSQILGSTPVHPPSVRAGATGLRRADLVRLYECLSCGAPLRAEPLSCSGCGRVYSVLDGRAVLMDIAPLSPKQNDVIAAHVADRTGAKRAGLRGLADRFRRATTATIFADDRTQVPLLVQKVRQRLPGPGLVVDVGAAEQYYRPALEPLGDMVAMDISVYSVTDLVADCHRLPFRAGTLDAICAVEVLEHLACPWIFFAEAARVLKPGGVLFGVTPQYAGTHGFPYDFFRYTQSGLRSLAESAGLALVEAWPIGGMWATLLHWYWANFARESRLRRVPGVNLAHHAWFQLVASLLDRADARAGRGSGPATRDHWDQLGFSFIIQKPHPSAGPEP